MAEAGGVLVTFIDGEPGRAFARSELPGAQVPDSFASETTLHLGDDEWLVERAEPLTAAEAVATGHLVLTVRRLQLVAPQEILYSLPTICDVLPEPSSAVAGADSLQLHEDDWRQVELASRSRTAAIGAELAVIERVCADHGRRDDQGRLFAFDRLHIRSITTIVEPLSRRRLRELLPAPDRTYQGVQFGGYPKLIADAFAFGYGPLAWYGTAEQDQVPVLGLHITARDGQVPAAALAVVLAALDLVIVDWCRRAVVEPAHLGSYLDAMRSH